MNSNFMNKLTRSVKMSGLKLKKHSPEILVVTGVAGTVVSTVLACKATTKVKDIMDEAKETVEIIHEGMETGEIRGQEYTVEDGKKDLTITYAQTGVKLVKLYGPAVLLGIASISSILTSHKILSKRNVAIAAAYTAVDKGFKEYRGRVVERFGAELDKELRYNIKAKEVEETVVDENGKETVVKKTIKVAGEPSIFSKFFDEASPNWKKDPEQNLMFLKLQQNYANEKLKADGYLFLNDVYRMLGIQKTSIGQLAGWIYDEGRTDIDNYVDFGIYDVADEAKRAFVNGYERSILLDFNCDGNIIDAL